MRWHHASNSVYFLIFFALCFFLFKGKIFEKVSTQIKRCPRSFSDFRDQVWLLFLTHQTSLLQEMDDDNDDDADTEDEDARTEASDCMSDVTEADGEVPKTVFDDI